MLAFISHSHEDRPAYSSLCLALDGVGVPRWGVSQLSPGLSLAEQLRSAIDHCDVCIFLATERSLQSKWCLAELGAFWGAGKKVIIYLADPTVEESDLPPQFHGNLWTEDAKLLVNAITPTRPAQMERIPTRDVGGLWIGEERQLEAFERSPIELKVQLKLEARDAHDLTGTYSVSAPEVEMQFTVVGTFMHNRFIKLEYDTTDRMAIRLGTVFLELQDDGTTLTGGALGYRTIAKKITTSELELCLDVP